MEFPVQRRTTVRLRTHPEAVFGTTTRSARSSAAQRADGAHGEIRFRPMLPDMPPLSAKAFVHMQAFIILRSLNMAVADHSKGERR